MPIPIRYTLQSLKVRANSSIVTISCIAGVVSVFIFVMAMANGFQKMLKITGSKENVIILRKGSVAEMMSIITREQYKIVGDNQYVKRDEKGEPLVSGEVVVVAPFFHKASKSNALAQVRGVTPIAQKVHPQVKIVKGRFFKEGMYEFVVGKNCLNMYEGLELNRKIKMGGREFKVVGIMESDGSLYESEVWCDAKILNETYKRPITLFSSLSVRLIEKNLFEKFKESLEKDPRANFDAKVESDFFLEQSLVMTTLIRVLGFLVAFVMGVGAVFAAFNTIYSSLIGRIKEIATLRAIGFSRIDVALTTILESEIIALSGGILGCIISLPLDNFTANTLNFQSFSQVAFTFDITYSLILQSILFSFLIGFLGGLLPAVRASKLKPADALREI